MPGRAGHDVYRLGMTVWLRCPVEAGHDVYNSSWEMEALCFYYHEHELKNINRARYGISNFFDLPEEPMLRISAESRELRFFTKEELQDIEIVVTHSDIVEDWFLNQ